MVSYITYIPVYISQYQITAFQIIHIFFLYNQLMQATLLTKQPNTDIALTNIYATLAKRNVIY